MPDQSHLDSRYFVDRFVYNCPFCNRRHVSYVLSWMSHFDWTNDKRCYIYSVGCQSCGKSSLHLSFKEIPVTEVVVSGHTRYRFKPIEKVSKDDVGKWLDDAMFFSVPSSFFVIDDRVPKILRELMTEAEGSLKSNFLTGASACARKIVYELARLSKATGGNYDDRVKSLKTIHGHVDPTFFDTLLTIQQVTSTKVHEAAYDGWESKHLRVILAALLEVLHEIYVAPALRQDRRKAVLDLKATLIPDDSGAPGAE